MLVGLFSVGGMSTANIVAMTDAAHHMKYVMHTYIGFALSGFFLFDD